MAEAGEKDRERARKRYNKLYKGGPGIANLTEITDPKKREPYEKDMAKDVRDSIVAARKGDRSAAALLLNSLRNSPNAADPADSAAIFAPHIPRQSFGSWLIERGILLGPNACFAIGRNVCEEEGFTEEEAEKIMRG